MKFSNKLYDVLKWIVIIAIPALVTFLSVVLTSLKVDAETVNVIVTILSALATFIGALIGISTSNYNKCDKEEE